MRIHQEILADHLDRLEQWAWSQNHIRYLPPNLWTEQDRNNVDIVQARLQDQVQELEQELSRQRAELWLEEAFGQLEDSDMSSDEEEYTDEEEETMSDIEWDQLP